jgi:hypothetical protein
MPRVGFDPTVSAFEQAKTVHALAGPLWSAKEFVIFSNTTELRENTDLETKQNKTSLRILQHIFA